MINNYNPNISPEELNGFIGGFSFLSNDELSEFISIYNLSFSLEQMIYIRDYFKNVKKMFPTYNQIFFFDEINKIRKSEKKNYSIYSASGVEGTEPILRASKDLLAKRNAINRSVIGAMPISFAAEIASEYLKHIDYSQAAPLFTPANNKINSRYYIHTDNGTPLFTYGAQEATSRSSAAHNVTAMLCPAYDMSYSEYVSHVEEFFSTPEIAEITSERATVKSPYGIFEILLNESEGVFVNLASIPEIEKNDSDKVTDLRSAINSCIGRHIFSASNIAIGILSRIADEHNLKVFIFAVKNSSHSLTFESTKNPMFSFDFDFIKAITNFTEHREYTFGNEIDFPIGEKKRVYLTDMTNSANQTYNAERLFNFGKHVACATARKLDKSPYKTSALAIVDAINALIAKGVSKNAISLSIHYSLLCGTDNSTELGKNLAAILGAYRSMMELCVSDTSPQISYNKNERSSVALASSKAPIRPIRSAFSNKNTHIYFYELKYDGDGLPDYEKYRVFIKFFYSLIEQNSVLSAFSVNENILNILQSASTDVSLSFNPDLSTESLSLSHGMLFETNYKLPLNLDGIDGIFDDIDGNLHFISNDIFYVASTSEKY